MTAQSMLLILFTLTLASPSVPLVLKVHLYVNLYCNNGYEPLHVPLHTKTNVSFVPPCRDLSAHQGKTNCKCPCGHLLPTVLPLCRSFQRGARGVPHDATRLRNRRHRQTGPHWWDSPAFDSCAVWLVDTLACHCALLFCQCLPLSFIQALCLPSCAAWPVCYFVFHSCDHCLVSSNI